MTVIVPVFNEEESISELSACIHSALINEFEKFKILFVDDGSTDRTLQEIKKNSNNRFISLRKNYGQTAAMKIGIQNTDSELVAFLDGDLQNDPIDIPKMVDKLIEGNFDCVCGWRRNRHDPFLKKYVSKRARFLRNLIIPDNIHDAGCTLKVMYTNLAKELNLIGELHRFIPSMMVMDGYKITEIEVQHHNRKYGRTKYNWRRMFKGYLDMIGLWFWGKYSQRPLHFFGGVSIGFFLLGSFLLSTSIFSYFFFDGLFVKILPLFSVFLILQSVLFLLIGLVAQLLIQNNFDSRPHNSNVIKEILL